MAKVMVVMDGQTVDYSLIVNLLKSGFDVSWAFNTGTGNDASRTITAGSGR